LQAHTRWETLNSAQRKVLSAKEVVFDRGGRNTGTHQNRRKRRKAPKKRPIEQVTQRKAREGKPSRRKREPMMSWAEKSQKKKSYLYRGGNWGTRCLLTRIPKKKDRNTEQWNTYQMTKGEELKRGV